MTLGREAYVAFRCFGLPDESPKDIRSAVTELRRRGYNASVAETARRRGRRRTLIECDNNVSEGARRLGVVEGTIRYRLKMLAPKLIAAGFNPFNKEESQ